MYTVGDLVKMDPTCKDRYWYHDDVCVVLVQGFADNGMEYLRLCNLNSPKQVSVFASQVVLYKSIGEQRREKIDNLLS